MSIQASSRSACGLFVVLLGVLAAASPLAVHYHLLKKAPLGAAGGGREYFDYLTVDSGTRRVYASHGTEVKVADADSAAVVGTISGLKQCHGIALVEELGKGFISDGGAAKTVIFDMATLKVSGEVKGEEDADSIIYDPASKRVFVFNGDAKSATVIDPANATVVKSIPLGGGPEFAAADGKGMVYDNIEDKNEVVAIDSHTLTIKSRWPVAPAGQPTALAMDREHRRLFVAGRNPQKLVILDADNGKVIQSFPISAGADANVYEPETLLLFASTREGMIHIFHEDTPDKFSEVETVKTEYGAKTMALDSKTHNLYLTTADFGAAPTPTPERPHPNPAPIPGTFHLLIYGK
ncbi:MAG: YVTN family beta-propeller domain-containing protein [Acidobacteria bacterium]|nr:MAG: YVTN family beta-propeller domain-containing protein [Acidobacteriota bacterium]